MDGQRERRQLREPAHHAGALSRIPRGLKVAFWAALLWTALSFFFASQIYIAARFEGVQIPWSVALSFSMPRWYVWGVLTPAIVWVDRWIGAGRTLRARVLWHVPLGVAWTCVSILIRLAIRPLRGSPLPASFLVFFLERFYWDLLIYAVIAGVSVARDYAAQATQREREAHQLAVQTADLERRLVEARFQSLRAQLQPHFLFNALNTISAFTETSPKTARRLMAQLGDLLRASLTHGSRPLVTLSEELTFLDDYVAIESARFEGRITVSVHADDDVLNAMVPSFLLQPLVENAIRHGVAPRLSGGHVEVTARRVGTILQVRVRDNGLGLPRGWQFDRDAGVGLRNVAARLEHLYGRSDLLRMMPAPSGGVDIELDLPPSVSPMASEAVGETASAGT